VAPRLGLLRLENTSHPSLDVHKQDGEIWLVIALSPSRSPFTSDTSTVVAFPCVTITPVSTFRKNLSAAKVRAYVPGAIGMNAY